MWLMREVKKIVHIFLVLILMGGCDSKKKEYAWKTGTTEYEGFPLLLRLPVGLDYDSLQYQYPRLFLVTHTLDIVQQSGLPDATYNKGLIEFDDAMVTLFSNNNSGLTVLVETFCGKRIYYMYVSNSADTETAMKHMQKNYSDCRLTWQLKNDSQWGFIRKYAKDYGL